MPKDILVFAGYKEDDGTISYCQCDFYGLEKDEFGTIYPSIYEISNDGLIECPEEASNFAGYKVLQKYACISEDTLDKLSDIYHAEALNLSGRSNTKAKQVERYHLKK